MKYSTIIFDLDGTLLDTAEGIMIGANHTAILMGAPELTVQQQRRFIGPPPAESFMRECGFNEEVAREAVKIYRSRYKEKGKFEAKHYSNIKELLVSLKEKNCTTAVATLKRDDLAKEILENFELNKHFDAIFGVDDADTLSKSDLILKCLEEIGQNDLSKVVLIGDSMHDAIGAEKVGIDFIAVTYGYGFESKVDAGKCKNVYVTESVEELFDFFELKQTIKY